LRPKEKTDPSLCDRSKDPLSTLYSNGAELGLGVPGKKIRPSRGWGLHQEYSAVWQLRHVMTTLLINIRAQNSVDFRLIAFAFATEKLQNISINAHIEHIFRLGQFIRSC